MDVITSHTNADFDTFASMIAAGKLYPGARLVFSGSLEKALSDALESLSLPVRFDKAREIDLDEVSRLILVDVRQAGRIGPFASLVGKPGMEVHIYDHHPETPDDIKGSLEKTARYGSTTTLLTLEIKARGIGLTPEEATLMMTGIYEDTGSLSYPSTTPRDYEAAAFLLEAGADLRVVTDLLRRELTPEEVSLLDKLLHSETEYRADGVEFVVAEGYLERYEGDISTLAHKIMDIQGMGALFMLVDAEDRVHLVARSRDERLDVGTVARALGGGGHAQAASATLKGVTLIEAKERLLLAVRKAVIPGKTARDIMSFPPVTVDHGAGIAEALDIMRRYGINAAPVVREGAMAGVITRQVLDKASYHGLSGMPVADCMTIEYESVSEDTAIDEIREKVVSHGQRILPVLKDMKVVGVITRTDLIKLLQEGLRKTGGKAKVRHLSRLMKETLPAWAYEMLKEIGSVASELGYKAYAVGGFARDLILRRENLDIDIVVEGDGIIFANEFASRRGGLKVRTHQRFKTAVLIFPDGYKLDVATARLEYYESPGALPTVEESSLKLDLYRRDFIMNTLAVALNPGAFGELIDFFGAQNDIKERTIRVIHNLSFIEDPTRMLRAVRFSEKFDFRIGRHTLNLIKNSVRLGMLERLSGARVFDELKHILSEDTAVRAVATLDELGILRLIHPGITWGKERELFLERAKEAIKWHELLYTGEGVEGWLVLYLALTDQLEEGEFNALARKLQIMGKKRQKVLAARGEGLKALRLLESGFAKRESQVYGILKSMPLEILLYLLARTDDEAARRAVATYVTRLKTVRTMITGEDLLAMGASEGPELGRVLDLILQKRLDGEVTSREEEEEAALKAFGKGRT